MLYEKQHHNMTQQRNTIFRKSFQKHMVMAYILLVILPYQLLFQICNAMQPR